MADHDKHLACIVLAAGTSRRFGSDKRKASLANGQSLLATTLDSIPRCFSDYVLVVQPGDESWARSFTEWRVRVANNAALGMGSSLASAIAVLPAGIQGILVVLGDMPWVRTATYESLIAAAQPSRIVVPRFAGQRGNPVAIGATFFPQLLQLQGDRGARALFETQASALHWIDCDDAGVLKDVDTREQLQSE